MQSTCRRAFGNRLTATRAAILSQPLERLFRLTQFGGPVFVSISPGLYHQALYLSKRGSDRFSASHLDLRRDARRCLGLCSCHFVTSILSRLISQTSPRAISR